MEEGKKILGVFLVVLFIIVVLGVVISRTASKNKKVPLIGGSLESVLFPDRPTPKPSIIVAKKTNTTSTTTSTSTKTGSTQTTEAGKTTTQNSQVPVVLGDTTSSTTNNSAGTGTTTGSTVTSTNPTTGSTSGTSGTTSTTSQTSKGGVNEAQSIPAAGTPTIYLTFALSALASGVALKRLV